MQTNNFRVTVVEEYDVVEICGALKVSYQYETQLHAKREGPSPEHLNYTIYISLPSFVLKYQNQLCRELNLP